MADVTPRLNSATDAADTRYAPLSWLAVAAVAVGGAFTVVLLFLWVVSVRENKSQYMPLLLAVPLAGVLLAFAARRSIRTSEGARAGTQLADTGWWLCVVSGGCYAAYLLAVDFSVRSDAERQLVQWASELAKGNPDNPDDPAVRDAFYKTMEPANQASPELRNPKIFQARYAGPFAVFRQTNLLLIAARNRDSAVITPKGLQGWEQTEEALTCEAVADLTCAEGQFPLVVRMKSVVTDKARQWQISVIDQFIPEDANRRPRGSRTRFGWIVARLNELAAETTTEFTYTLLNQQVRQPTVSAGSQFVPPAALGQSVALDVFAAGRTPRPTAEKVLLSSFARTQVLGGLGLFWTSGGEVADDFFAREDGKPLSAEERKALVSVWTPRQQTFDRLLPPGRRTQIGTLWNPTVEAGETTAVVKCPVELRPDNAEFQQNPKLYSTGRLVFLCDDPQLARDLAEARTELAGTRDVGRIATPTMPDDLAQRQYRLRLVRLESNLTKVLPPTESMRSGGP